MVLNNDPDNIEAKYNLCTLANRLEQTAKNCSTSLVVWYTFPFPSCWSLVLNQFSKSKSSKYLMYWMAILLVSGKSAFYMNGLLTNGYLRVCILEMRRVLVQGNVRRNISYARFMSIMRVRSRWQAFLRCSSLLILVSCLLLPCWSLLGEAERWPPFLMVIHEHCPLASGFSAKSTMLAGEDSPWWILIVQGIHY